MKFNKKVMIQMMNTGNEKPSELITPEQLESYLQVMRKYQATSLAIGGVKIECLPDMDIGEEVVEQEEMIYDDFA
jgi:hypothetical protein